MGIVKTRSQQNIITMDPGEEVVQNDSLRVNGIKRTKLASESAGSWLCNTFEGVRNQGNSTVTPAVNPQTQPDCSNIFSDERPCRSGLTWHSRFPLNPMSGVGAEEVSPLSFTSTALFLQEAANTDVDDRKPFRFEHAVAEGGIGGSSVIPSSSAHNEAAKKLEMKGRADKDGDVQLRTEINDLHGCESGTFPRGGQQGTHDSLIQFLIQKREGEGEGEQLGASVGRLGGLNRVGHHSSGALQPSLTLPSLQNEKRLARVPPVEMLGAFSPERSVETGSRSVIGGTCGRSRGGAGERRISWLRGRERDEEERLVMSVDRQQEEQTREGIDEELVFSFTAEPSECKRMNSSSSTEIKQSVRSSGSRGMFLPPFGHEIVELVDEETEADGGDVTMNRNHLLRGVVELPDEDEEVKVEREVSETFMSASAASVHTPTDEIVPRASQLAEDEALAQSLQAAMDAEEREIWRMSLEEAPVPAGRFLSRHSFGSSERRRHGGSAAPPPFPPHAWSPRTSRTLPGEEAEEEEGGGGGDMDDVAIVMRALLGRTRPGEDEEGGGGRMGLRRSRFPLASSHRSRGRAPLAGSGRRGLAAAAAAATDWEAAAEAAAEGEAAAAQPGRSDHGFQPSLRPPLPHRSPFLAPVAPPPRHHSSAASMQEFLDTVFGDEEEEEEEAEEDDDFMVWLERSGISASDAPRQRFPSSSASASSSSAAAAAAASSASSSGVRMRGGWRGGAARSRPAFPERRAGRGGGRGRREVGLGLGLGLGFPGERYVRAGGRSGREGGTAGDVSAAELEEWAVQQSRASFEQRQLSLEQRLDFLEGLEAAINRQVPLAMRLAAVDRDFNENDYEMLLQLDEVPGEPSRKGASQAEINAIPVYRVTGRHLPCEPCSICLEDCLQRQMMRKLLCQHSFHKHCIDEWLHRQAVCPICKRDIRDN